MNYAYRIDVHQRNAGKASDKCNELVQIVRADPREQGTDANHKEAEEILLPLDVGIVLASPTSDDG